MAMLMKPATPLTVILLASFALLLLSVLSTPIVKSIPLAKVDDISFGVLGYCMPSGCSEFQIGYKFEGELKKAQSDKFNLPENIRASLSSLLIVHPIATFLTLVCLCLAGAAHFHSPSHSPRYLLGLLILLLPTLLVSMLAFLVDILLFVPNLQWGGWIVLGATILLTVSGVMTCAMRRTLVSRKARKLRIAENAEMSGENFYNRQNANAVKLDPPVVTSTPGTSVTAGDSLPAFATYDSRTRSPDNEERPLTSQSPPPPGFGPDSSPFYSVTGSEPYGPPGPLPGERPQGRDPPGVYGMPPPMRGGSMRGRGPGYGPPRGRGGHPMRGRGGYPGGPRGPPPPGFNGRGGPRGGMMMGRGGRSTPGFPLRNSPGPDGYGYPYGSGPGPGQRGPSPGHRGPSPIGGPPGQDIEMETSPVNLHPGLSPSPGVPAVHSPTSLYSRDNYVPPRSNWATEPTLPVVDPIAPPSRSPVSQPTPPPGQTYYEDVDPRFAQQPETNMPSTLTAGGQHGEPEPKTSLDDQRDGARSPTASETSSHFTSVSQRGINPRWRPPESENVHAKRRVQERQDLVLGSNPDFELQNSTGRMGTGPSRRRPTMPSLPMIPATPTPPPMSPGGRYP